MTSAPSSRSSSTTNRASVSVICVRLTPRLAKEVEDQLASLSWQIGYEHAPDYLSPRSWSPLSANPKTARACIAFINFDEDTPSALASVEFLQKALAGRIHVVALSSNQDHDLILNAMRVGCTEYLTVPIVAHSFHEAMHRLERRFSSDHEQVPVVRGSVISFLGAKGGVGATTLAVHLALHLVVSEGKKVLLIDNHPGLGHVCLYLGLEGAHHSFRDLLRNVDRLDADLLKGFVVHHASGLDVIASAELSGVYREIHPEAIRRTLEFVRMEYDFILVDCCTLLDDGNMAAVEHSDRVYLIATPDVGAVRDLARLYDALGRYQQPAAKLSLIVNRSGSKVAMSAEQIEKAVRVPIAMAIPNTYVELVRAANMGTPVPTDDKSGFSSQLRDWSRELVSAGAAEAPVTPKKRFTFWKSA